MKKKILSLLLALVMALSLVPTSVLAAPVDLGKAHVIVENTTFTKPVDGKAPAWTGTLVDTWVKLTEDSTVMRAVSLRRWTPRDTPIPALPTSARSTA